MKVLSILLLALTFTSCEFHKEAETKTQRSTLFIGIDVSGSFTRTKKFRDGMKFLGEYLHAHLNNKGGLEKPTDLYVGGVGGNLKEDPQDFFPIHDFKGLNPDQIEVKLLKEFSSKKDRLTDFNTFFRRIATMVKQKNLVFAPLEVLIVSDGIPEIQGKSKLAIKQAYSKIDLSPIEYITRNVSIRLLYSGPRVGNNWRNYVPTSRVKIWTVEPRVMYGWKTQKKRGGDNALYVWMRDNIDLRIKSRGLLVQN